MRRLLHGKTRKNPDDIVKPYGDAIREALNAGKYQKAVIGLANLTAVLAQKHASLWEQEQHRFILNDVLRALEDVEVHFETNPPRTELSHRIPRLNPRHNPRLNPRRKLRADALFLVEAWTQKTESRSDHTPPGTFWVSVTFFDPEVDRDPSTLDRRAIYFDSDMLKQYKSYALGGLQAHWPSEQAFEKGQPGVVEYIAAGSGFGPDVLEESANIIGRPLTLGRGWNPAIVLFDRYGGTVHPRRASARAGVVHDDVRYAAGTGAVKSAASDAFNEGLLSAGILPRYQKDDDRYLEDTAKLDADAAR